MQRDMIEDPRVKFVGYRVPHPLKTSIEIKVGFCFLRDLADSDEWTHISSQKGDARQLSTYIGYLQRDGRGHSCNDVLSLLL